MSPRNDERPPSLLSPNQKRLLSRIPTNKYKQLQPNTATIPTQTDFSSDGRSSENGGGFQSSLRFYATAEKAQNKDHLNETEFSATKKATKTAKIVMPKFQKANSLMCLAVPNNHVFVCQPTGQIPFRTKPFAQKKTADLSAIKPKTPRLSKITLKL